MRTESFLLFVVSAAAGALAAQTPTDLRTWTAEHYLAGAGNWVPAIDGSSVTQTLNGWPTMFFGSQDAHYARIEGRVQVTGSDDDYFGFALGFQPGDFTNPNADYLLVDWKGATQSYNWGAPSCTPSTTANRGLAVSRVEGMPTADELWGHVNLDTVPCSGPNDRVTQLQRATNLGSTAWVRNRIYAFRFDFTPTRLDVFVDQVLELSITGTFRNGRMAFYNFSQGPVVYSAFNTDCIAEWSNYGTGHPGTLGVPSLVAATQPLLGTTVNLQMTGVNPTPDFGLLGWGWTPADLPSGYGGRLMLNIALLEGTLAVAAPSMSTASLRLPADQTLCGVRVYCQFAHIDPGASHGFAFSPGLRLLLGN